MGVLVHALTEVDEDAYAELLQVLDGHIVAEEVDQSILEHASVTVALRS